MVLTAGGSLFNLEGEDHRRQRKLLVPPFHGKRMHKYERVIEEEFLREPATWPDDEEFETLEPIMRITLNAILRAVFGAEGPNSTHCASCYHDGLNSPCGWQFCQFHAST